MRTFDARVRSSCPGLQLLPITIESRRVSPPSITLAHGAFSTGDCTEDQRFHGVKLMHHCSKNDPGQRYNESKIYYNCYANQLRFLGARCVIAFPLRTNAAAICRFSGTS